MKGIKMSTQAKTKTTKKTKTKTTEKTEKNEDLFARMGIHVDDGKFIIDTNQTKAFLDTLKGTVENAAKNVQEEFVKNKATSKDTDKVKSTCIKVDKKEVETNLEKTQGFIDDFGKMVGKFLADLDTSIEKHIDKK